MQRGSTGRLLWGIASPLRGTRSWCHELETYHQELDDGRGRGAAIALHCGADTDAAESQKGQLCYAGCAGSLPIPRRSNIGSPASCMQARSVCRGAYLSSSSGLMRTSRCSVASAIRSRGWRVACRPLGRAHPLRTQASTARSKRPYDRDAEYLGSRAAVSERPALSQQPIALSQIGAQRSGLRYRQGDAAAIGGPSGSASGPNLTLSTGLDVCDWWDAGRFTLPRADPWP